MNVCIPPENCGDELTNEEGEIVTYDCDHGDAAVKTVHLGYATTALLALYALAL